MEGAATSHSRDASAGALISVPRILRDMPRTLEVKCADGDCELDMAELHYTYDMPPDTGAEDFACPYCGGAVEAIEV